MSKENSIESAIAKLYKSKSLDLLMYGYVLAVTHFFQNVSIRKGIEEFMKEMNIDSGDFDISSAEITFQRMRAKHREVK
jgi:hypothetical protein